MHLDHGVCRLTGLRTVEDEDRIALEFADGAELLIAADELDRLWRYGGEGGATLDRIGGDAWHKKRAEIEAELTRTARGSRQSRRCPRPGLGAQDRRPRRTLRPNRPPLPLSAQRRPARRHPRRPGRPRQRPPDEPAAVRRCRLRQDRGRHPRRRRHRHGRVPGRGRRAHHRPGAPAPRRVPPPLRGDRHPRRGADPRRRVQRRPRRARRGQARRGRHRRRHAGPGDPRLQEPRPRRHRRGAALRRGRQGASSPASPSTCWQ